MASSKTNVGIKEAMRGIPGMDQAEIREFLKTAVMPLRLALVYSDGDPVIYPVWLILEDKRFDLLLHRQKFQKVPKLIQIE